MTDPDRKAFEDLIKASLVMFVMLELPNYLTVQTRQHNPEIGADEVIELTIIRSRVIPPQHPLPVADYAGVGVVGYVTG